MYPRDMFARGMDWLITPETKHNPKKITKQTF